MGVFAGILGGLAETGNQVAQGKISAREDKQKQDNWNKVQALAVRQQQETERTEAFKEKMQSQKLDVLGTFKGKDGKNYAWTKDPTGKISLVGLPGEEITPDEEKAQAFQRLSKQFGEDRAFEMIFPGIKETESEKLKNDLKLYHEAVRSGDKLGAMAILSKIGGAGLSRMLRPPTGLGKGGWRAYGVPEDRLSKLADMWRLQGIKPPDKNTAEAVYDYISEKGLKFQRKPSQQEQLVGDTIKQVSPMVDRLTKFIEDKGLENDNSVVFSRHSLVAQYGRFLGYQHGLKPEEISATMFKDAAALQVMGARPWMTMGRGKYMYETVKQHLPSPTDTPAQLYDKVTWLRDNILADAQQSLQGLIGQGENDAAKEAQDYLDRLERSTPEPQNE